MEANVPDSARQSVLREVLLAHPYEEPAFFFHPVKEPCSKTGLGCLAWLEPAR